MTSKPNVMLIVLDCLRSDRVFGPGRTAKTPVLDDLREKSCGFSSIFVENSITAPSFASLFTGRYARNHGVLGMVGVKLDESCTTLAEAFAANGYETYAEVTGPLNPILGMDKGFAHYHYRSQQEYSFTDWGRNLLSRLQNKELIEPFFVAVHLWELHVPRQVRPEFDSEEFGASPYDRALSSLDPFIGELIAAVGPETAVVLTGDHGECVDEIPAEGTLLPYFLKKLDLPPVGAQLTQSIDSVTDLMAEEPRLHQFAAEMSRLSGENRSRLRFRQRLRMMLSLLLIGLTRYRLQMKRGLKKGFFHTLRQKLNDIALFFSVALGRADAAQFQLVRNSLEEHKLQHGYHIYDYLQRVPLLFHAPGLVPTGKVVTADLRHIDLMPTLIEAFELDASTEGCDGESYFAYIREGGKDRPIFLEARGGAQAEKVFLIRGVRRDGQKVAYAPFEDDAPTEYYDLCADSCESMNLADSRTEEAATLREEAEALSQSFAGASGNTLSARENLEMVKRLKSLGYM